MKVMIGLPTMSYVHTFLMSRILGWLLDNKVNLAFYATINSQPVDRAREEIVDEFLKTDATHLFMIDSDTIPPHDAIYKLLDADEDIISGLTPIVAYDKDKEIMYRKWNCADFDGNLLSPNTGIKEVRGAGGSCLMIKRNVLETLSRPCFRNTFKFSNDGKVEHFISEDVFFIVKAIGQGFKPKADTSVVCMHYKQTLW